MPKGSKHTKRTKRKMSYWHQKNKIWLGRHHTDETKIKMSKIRIEKKIIPWNKNKKHPKYEEYINIVREIGKKKAKNQWGAKNPNWKGGKSFEPYPSEFNKKLKKEIHKRDNYTCELCGDFIPKFINHKNAFLTIHHIDYNKTNSHINNLITLCNFCNSSVNKNRENWMEFFQQKV